MLRTTLFLSLLALGALAQDDAVPDTDAPADDFNGEISEDEKVEDGPMAQVGYNVLSTLELSQECRSLTLKLCEGMDSKDCVAHYSRILSESCAETETCIIQQAEVCGNAFSSSDADWVKCIEDNKDAMAEKCPTVLCRAKAQGACGDSVDEDARTKCTEDNKGIQEFCTTNNMQASPMDLSEAGDWLSLIVESANECSHFLARKCDGKDVQDCLPQLDEQLLESACPTDIDCLGHHYHICPPSSDPNGRTTCLLENKANIQESCTDMNCELQVRSLCPGKNKAELQACIDENRAEIESVCLEDVVEYEGADVQEEEDENSEPIAPSGDEDEGFPKTEADENEGAEDAEVAAEKADPWGEHDEL